MPILGKVTESVGRMAAKAKAVTTAAVQGFGASMSMFDDIYKEAKESRKLLQEVLIDTRKSKLSLNELVLLAVSNETIQKDLLQEARRSNYLLETYAMAGINYGASNVTLSLDEDTVDLLNSLNNKRANYFKSSEKAVKIWEKISNTIFDKDFETKAAKFEKGSDIIAKGFHKISESLKGFNETSKFLPRFAVGLAGLGLAIWAFGEVVSGEALVKTVIGLFGIGLAFRFLFSREMQWGLAKFAVGIALTGLAIWAFSKIVTWETLTPVIGSLLALGGVFWLFNKIGMTPQTGTALILMGAGIGAIGIGLQLWPADFRETYGYKLLFLTGLGAVVSTLFAGSSPGAIGMILTGAAIGAIGVGLMLWPANFRDNYGYQLLFLTGVGVVFAAAGAASPLILAGALAMGAIGLSLMAISGSLWLLNSVPIDPVKIGTFSGAIKNIASTYFEIGGPIDTPMMLAGAAAMATVAISMLPTIGALQYLSKIEIDGKKIGSYLGAIRSLANTYLKIGGPIQTPIIALGAVAITGIALSMMAIIKPINDINASPIVDNKKVIAYIDTIDLLSNRFRKYGKDSKISEVTTGIAFVKGMASSSIELIKTIGQINTLGLGENDANKAGIVIDVFLTSLANTFKKNEQKNPAIKKGINSFIGIGNNIRDIASGLKLLSELKFVKYSVVNGKIVPTEMIDLSTGLETIGLSLGKMFHSLGEPLAQIGSHQNDITIFGMRFTNPFGTKAKAGLDSFKNISDILNPIANTIKIFIDNQIGPDQVGKFNIGLLSIFVTLSKINDVFVNKSNSYQTLQAVEKTTDLINQVGKIDSGNLEKTSTNLTSLYDFISSPKYTKTVAGLTATGSKLSTIKNEFNGIDLQKLNVFKDISKNMADAASDNRFMDLISNILTLIQELINVQQLLQQNQQAQQSFIPSSNPSIPLLNSPNPVLQPYNPASNFAPQTPQVEMNSSQQNIMTQLNSTIEKLLHGLSVSPNHEWSGLITEAIRQAKMF